MGVGDLGSRSTPTTSREETRSLPVTGSNAGLCEEPARTSGSVSSAEKSTPGKSECQPNYQLQILVAKIAKVYSVGLDQTRNFRR
jgi:hypothetical protein